MHRGVLLKQIKRHERFIGCWEEHTWGGEDSPTVRWSQVSRETNSASGHGVMKPGYNLLLVLSRNMDVFSVYKSHRRKYVDGY